jgi:hypothetical protein
MWYDPRDGTGASDRVEVQLAISRDGIAWERPWRRPIISPGSPGLDGSGQIWPLSTPIIRENEIWVYYLSSPESHLGLRNTPNYLSDSEHKFYDDPAPNTSVLARAIWRLDRLIGAEAGPRGGFIVTPIIRFGGERLNINADCGASGAIRIELERPDRDPISGYSINDAIPIQGNGISLQARWQGGRSLRDLDDREVRLRIELNGAVLYSFQFVGGGI